MTPTRPVHPDNLSPASAHLTKGVNAEASGRIGEKYVCVEKKNFAIRKGTSATARDTVRPSVRPSFFFLVDRHARRNRRVSFLLPHCHKPQPFVSMNFFLKILSGHGRSGHTRVRSQRWRSAAPRPNSTHRRALALSAGAACPCRCPTLPNQFLPRACWRGATATARCLALAQGRGWRGRASAPSPSTRRARRLCPGGRARWWGGRRSCTTAPTLFG